jgi:hypothetical protein
VSQVPSHVRAVLICSAAVTPDLGECTPQLCEGAMRVPAEFGNPSTCFMHAQTYLAQTRSWSKRPGQDHLRAKEAVQYRVDDQRRAAAHLLWGHQRRFERTAGTSALPLIPAVLLSRCKRLSGSTASRRIAKDGAMIVAFAPRYRTVTIL